VECDEVSARLAELDYEPLTSPEAGRLLYALASEPGIEDVLELGFAHGTSTAYVAAALEEKGVGSITTIDRASALDRSPNVHQVLGHLGLDSYVRPLYASSSYNWELMRLLERQMTEAAAVPRFDFCFIDGAHTWETDGFAFLLVDKLLRPDRWILFDDMHWSMAASASTGPEELETLSADELNTAQIERVFEILVRNHPNYGEFLVIGNYGSAYKLPTKGEAHHRQDVTRILGPHVLQQLITRRRGRSLEAIESDTSQLGQAGQAHPSGAERIQ